MDVNVYRNPQLIIRPITASDKLQCEGCAEYMVPPIFICVNGHRSCAECRIPESEQAGQGYKVYWEMPVFPQKPRCAVCLANNDLRYLQLETVTYFRTYTCRWHTNGCDVTSMLSHQIRYHEYNCPRRIYYHCVIGNRCDFTCHGSQNMITHIREDHPEEKVYEIIDNRTGVCEAPLPNVKEKFWIMLFDGEFFSLWHCITKLSKEWIVRLQGYRLHYRLMGFNVRVDILGRGGIILHTLWLKKLKLATMRIKLDSQEEQVNFPGESSYRITIIRNYHYSDLPW